MEVCVDIDEDLLREFDRAVGTQRTTGNAAVRGAISAWISQARRDAALRELFDTASDPESPGEGYQEDVLERLPTHPAGSIDEPLPHRGHLM